MRVAVAGATGFVGRRLTRALDERGHDVVALTRRPDEYLGAGLPVGADVDDPGTVRRGLSECEVAYYLVHRLGHGDLVERERRSAAAFGVAAWEAGVRRVVTVGGLVPRAVAADPTALSPHLRGRLAVERALGAGGVPVTALRASIVLGAGSAAWEMMRQLSAGLPLLFSPLRSRTPCQPIAAADLVGYLLDVLDDVRGTGRLADRVLEVGGSTVVPYTELFRRVAQAHGRRGVVVEVPAVSAAAEKAAIAALTDVDPVLAADLLESLDHPAVVEDPSARDLLPRRPRGLDAAIALALDEQVLDGWDRP